MAGSRQRGARIKVTKLEKLSEILKLPDIDSKEAYRQECFSVSGTTLFIDVKYKTKYRLSKEQVKAIKKLGIKELKAYTNLAIK